MPALSAATREASERSVDRDAMRMMAASVMQLAMTRMATPKTVPKRPSDCPRSRSQPRITMAPAAVGISRRAIRPPGPGESKTAM